MSPLVLQRERSQFPRQCEDGMYIGSGQKLAFARLKPASTRVALAPRAVPVFCRSCRRTWSYVRSRCSWSRCPPKSGSATAC